MISNQKSNERANSAQTSESATNLSAPTPVNSGDLSGYYLNDYLKDPVDRHNARLMVRAWFLAHTLQDDVEQVQNPSSIHQNVYLFELLDSFLSQPVVIGEGVSND